MHCFQMFRSGDLCVCDKTRSAQPQILDYEAPKVTIKKDNNQTYGEFAQRFQVSDETVKLHLNCIGKMYTTYRRNPARINIWKPVSRFFLGTAIYLYLIEYSPVTID